MSDDLSWLEEESEEPIEKPREKIIHDTKPAFKPTIKKIEKEDIIALKQEIKEYIRELLKKERKIEIDPKKVWKALQELDENDEDYEFYKVISNRAKTGRYSGYLGKYVSFINRNLDEFKKEVW